MKRTLQERMVNMAVKGYLNLNIEYDPEDKLFELFCENPYGTGRENYFRLVGDRLELLLAMAENRVASQDIDDDEAIALKRLQKHYRSAEKRCPKCKCSVMRIHDHCYNCGEIFTEGETL